MGSTAKGPFTLFCAVCFFAMAPGRATAIEPDASWDWQLTGPVDLDRPVAIYDLHPDLVTQADIVALKARGIRTVCYVSVGTLEKTSLDHDRFPAAVIGNTYDDWPDERFLDVRRQDILLPLMQARFERCKALGFDAIEPDNMDVHDNDSGFALKAADSLAYVLALADIAHGMGLAIAQKNTPELTSDLVGTMDFVITESCFQDGWCAAVNAYAQAGKAILDAEYNDRAIDLDAACEVAVAHHISMIVKDRDLTSQFTPCPMR